MARDLTLDKYSGLMLALMAKYKVMTVAEYLTMPRAGEIAVIYHEVGDHPERAAAMALLGKRLGLRSTYYFRWDPKATYWKGAGQDRLGNFPEMQVIEAKLYGHEVGYLHQEGEDAAARLARLRELAPVRTATAEVGDTMGGPFSAEFSEFFHMRNHGRSWISGPGQNLGGSGPVEELLRSGKHPMVLIGVPPDRWK